MNPDKLHELEKIVEQNQGKTLTGIVKWFDKKKGYGFILNPHDDVFVHYSEIDEEGYRNLDEGEIVEYNLDSNTLNGLSAKYVRRQNQ